MSFSGWILIDRSGKHFGTILNFLRDGRVCLPDVKRDLVELQAEAKYYLVQELVEILDTAIKQIEAEVEPVCRVPLITSRREEQLLLATSTKVLKSF